MFGFYYENPIRKVMVPDAVSSVSSLSFLFWLFVLSLSIFIFSFFIIIFRSIYDLPSLLNPSSLMPGGEAVERGRSSKSPTFPGTPLKREGKRKLISEAPFQMEGGATLQVPVFPVSLVVVEDAERGSSLPSGFPRPQHLFNHRAPGPDNRPDVERA